MDFGIPAIAAQMANMEASQTMTTNAMRRGLDQVEQVGDAIVQMMNDMQVPPPVNPGSGSRVDLVL